jgi:protein phosphatase
MAASRILFKALSDRGTVRAENQDRVFAGPLPGDGERHLFAVADGVGGREGGAWASERALELLTEALSAPGSSLRGAADTANRGVFEDASKREHRGAATTLVAVLVEGTTFTWANVGDSRAYILRNRQLHQLTRDHSFVEEEITAGRLTREEAATSPHRNVITRSIGHHPEVEVDSKGPFQLEPGDIFLLCSDGLHQLVTVAEMTERALLLEPAPAAEALVRLANQRGGPDNVSVVIFAFEREALATATARPQGVAATAPSGKPERPGKGPSLRLIGASIVGALLAGIVIGLSRPF